MNRGGFMFSCLVILALSQAAAGSDASLNTYNSEYNIDQFIGGASFVDSCTLLISPLRVKGNVKPMYVPSGSENDISSLSTNYKNQLEFTLERHGSFDSMSITLPNCNANSAKGNSPLIPLPNMVGVWCRHCSNLENSMLATGTIASTAISTDSTIVLVIENEHDILLEDGEQSHRRSLLQNAAASCTIYPCTGCKGPLTVGSTSTPFDSCISLAPELQLFFSLAPSGTGTTFKGGLWAKSSEFYAGFGFSPDGGMIGADSVMIYPDTASSTGASITGMTFQSYQVAAINADKGSFPLSDTSAAINPDGSISGTFSVQLASPFEQVKTADMTYIYVSNGPMLPGNVLGDHMKSLRGGLFGANVMQMNTIPVDSTPATAVPDSAATPKPTPLPEATTKPATTTTKPATFCSLTIAGEVKDYKVCYPVKVGSEFQVFYTLEADPLDLQSSTLSMAVQAKSTGYVGVGFPSKPGQMTNAGAAILQACSSCPTGAAIKEFYMTGTNKADVFASTGMNMSDFTASAANGVISGAWKMKLKGTAASPTQRRRRLFQSSTTTTAPIYPASEFPLIYAAGPISSTGTLLSHTDANDASGYLNLLQGLPGAADGGEIAPEIYKNDSAELAHMWCAAISWGFLIPMAIIISRYFKPHTEKWFVIHRAVAVTGFLLAIAALVLGFSANNGWDTDQPVHRDLGVSCTVLGLVQMFAVINKLRPAKDHKLRKYWFFGHAWIGRTAVILAIANIYYGIINVAELGTWAWAVYTAVLACIVALGLVMEVVNWKAKKNSVASSGNLEGAFVKGGASSTGVSTADPSRQNSKQLNEIELN